MFNSTFLSYYVQQLFIYNVLCYIIYLIWNILDALLYHFIINQSVLQF